jgi:hypothetical protein
MDDAEAQLQENSFAQYKLDVQWARLATEDQARLLLVYELSSRLYDRRFQLPAEEARTQQPGLGLVFCLKEVRYFRRQCIIWRKVLRGEGWQEVKDELSFEPHLGGANALFTLMPNEAIRPALGNKRSLVSLLMAAGLDCIPFTAFDWSEYYQEVELSPLMSPLWFLKASSENDTDGVFPVLFRTTSGGLTVSDTTAESAAPRGLPKVDIDTAMIQRAIRNPALLQGRKFVVSMFVLFASPDVNEHRVMVYNEASVRQAAANYAEQSIEKDVHTTCQRTGEPLLRASVVLEKWATVILPRIAEMVDTVMAVIGSRIHWPATADSDTFSTTLGSDKGLPSFRLLRWDVVLDDELQPFLLEINPGPELSYKGKEHAEWQDVVLRMLREILSAIVYPSVLQAAPRPGGWQEARRCAASKAAALERRNSR